MQEQDTQALAVFRNAYDQATGIKVNEQQAGLILAYAQRYNLDPLARHVMVLYGAPYVTEKGAIAHARRQKGYRGYSIVNLQPEEVEAIGESEGSYAWRCSVWVKGYQEPVEDYGVVSPQEIERMEVDIRENVEGDARWGQLSEELREREIRRRMWRIPLLVSPAKMCRARAIRRAHERAFPLDEGSYSPEVNTEEENDASD